MFTALLQPHFDYAYNARYRSLDTAVKNKLQTTQNKIIWYLFKYDCNRHIGFSNFKNTNYLDVKGRVDYLSLSVMHNVFNNAGPCYMCDMNRIRHLYKTHKSNASYVVPHVKGQGCKSFKFNGIKMWNELPVNVKTIQTKHV